MMVWKHRVKLTQLTQVTLEEHVVLILVIIKLSRSPRGKNRPFEIISRIFMIQVGWLCRQVILLYFLTNQLVLKSDSLISHQSIVICRVHLARRRFILFGRNKHLELFVSDKLKHLLLLAKQVSFLLCFNWPRCLLFWFLIRCRVYVVVGITTLAWFSGGCCFINFYLLPENPRYNDFLYTECFLNQSCWLRQVKLWVVYHSKPTLLL